jgi:hypothetical protein
MGGLPVNRFILAEDPQEAAVNHNDKHVVKMILEEAQMLSTAHHLLGNANDAALLYKPTHVNHPCSIWVRSSSENYRWAVALFESLCNEYTYRYGKTHKSFGLYSLLKELPEKIPHGSLTAFPQAMPDYCKRESSVEAYRTYYIMEKSGIAKWTNRTQPEWWNRQHSLMAILEDTHEA